MEKEKPGALDKAAALQHKSVDDVLGAGEINEQFTELRENYEKEFD